MHLAVQVAIISLLFGWLEAVWMLTSHNPVLMSDVLSEVKSLCWKQLQTNGHLEVFVGYGSILVVVELVENLLKFLLRNVEAPEVKLVLELLWLYSVLFVEVKVHESLPQCLPLELDFVHDLLFNIVL